MLYSKENDTFATINETQTKKLLFMDKYSFLNAASTAFFGDLYDKYLENPDAIEPSWRAFFQGFDFGQEQYGSSIEEAVPVMVQQVVNNDAAATSGLSEKVKKEFGVLNLINAYRTYGHLHAQISPLSERESLLPNLSLENFGLSSNDLAIVFDAASEIGLPP